MSNNWKSDLLGNVATLQRGFDLPHRLRRSGKVPIVTSSGVEGMHNEAKVKAPGVVTGRYGTIGEVFYVNEDFWPHNTTLYVRDFHGNDPLFISYLLRTIDFHMHSGKTGVPGVNRNDLHEITVSIPLSLTEQKAIAEALSDADALIEALEQLIAKKRQVKQGAMQELLTGKRRLLGFGDEWKVKKLGEVCGRITTGKLDANAMKDDGEYRFYTCAKEYYQIDTYAFDTEALLVSGNGANVGYIHYYKGKFNAYQRTYVLSEFSEDIFFIKLFMDQYLQKRIKVEVNAGNTPYIKMDTLAEMEINLPKTQEEQTAIAEILSDMDAEIAALEGKLSKARQVKQGMMQELLTGKVRLV